MQSLNASSPLVRPARTAALAAGVTGTAALVGVIAGENIIGPDFMTSSVAAVAAWTGFLSAGLLVAALTGVLARVAPVVGAPGRRVLWLMQLSATVMAAATATLPLVVVGIADSAPELVNDPPVAVPATFILSGACLGVCGIALAVMLRRTGLVPSRAAAFLLVASVVAIMPLPSRQFLLCFAVAVVLGASVDQEADTQHAHEDRDARVEHAPR